MAVAKIQIQSWIDYKLENEMKQKYTIPTTNRRQHRIFISFESIQMLFQWMEIGVCGTRCGRFGETFVYRRQENIMFSLTHTRIASKHCAHFEKKY